MAKKTNEERYAKAKERGEKRKARRTERFKRQAARKGMTTDELHAKRKELWGQEIADRQAGSNYTPKSELQTDAEVDSAKQIKASVDPPKSGGGFAMEDAGEGFLKNTQGMMDEVSGATVDFSSPNKRMSMQDNTYSAWKRKKGYKW